MGTQIETKMRQNLMVSVLSVYFVGFAYPPYGGYGEGALAICFDEAGFVKTNTPTLPLLSHRDTQGFVGDVHYVNTFECRVLKREASPGVWHGK